MEHETRDLVVIGSGPAGLTAAIYAARAGLDPLVISGMQPGGQLSITTDVENFPGFADIIDGPWLMEQMADQAKRVGAGIRSDLVVAVEPGGPPHRLVCDSGARITTRALILAMGASARWLGLESETRFRGFGVSACATCDGFFFRGKPVAVIGGGNTAAEEALYLTRHASSVHLIHRRDRLRAEHALRTRVLAHESIHLHWNRQVTEILGEGDPPGVTGIRLASTREGEEAIGETLAVEGVFVAIGHDPETWLVREQLELDPFGYIVTRPDSTATSIPGLFAAGDVRDRIYRQAVTAAGMGCMAALEAEKYLAREDAAHAAF